MMTTVAFCVTGLLVVNDLSLSISFSHTLDAHLRQHTRMDFIYFAI